MATRKRKKSTATRGQPRRIGPGCRVHPTPIANLGEFFNICSGVLRSDTEFWFRGHADLTWNNTTKKMNVNGEMHVAGEVSIKVYAQITAPTLGSSTHIAIWEDTDDGNAVYLMYKKINGDTVGVELT